MKRTTTILLIVAMALALLTGCGGSNGEQTAEVLVEPASPASVQSSAPEEAQATAHDWSEPNAVDDSFSFQSDGNFQHFLQAYVDRWVNGGEILDSEFIGIDKIALAGFVSAARRNRRLVGKQQSMKGKNAFVAACSSVAMRTGASHSTK